MSNQKFKQLNTLQEKLAYTNGYGDSLIHMLAFLEENPYASGPEVHGYFQALRDNFNDMVDNVTEEVKYGTR